MALQYVTIVAYGGTPVRICNSRGGPLATTGSGALVFNNGPTLDNPILNNPTYSGNLAITGNLTVSGTITGQVSMASVFPSRLLTSGATTVVMLSTDYEVVIAYGPAASVAVVLPPSPYNGQRARVSDGNGALLFGSIEYTVTSASGGNINGQATLVMNGAYQSTEFRYNTALGRWNTQ